MKNRFLYLAVMLFSMPFIMQGDDHEKNNQEVTSQPVAAPQGELQWEDYTTGGKIGFVVGKGLNVGFRVLPSLCMSYTMGYMLRELITHASGATSPLVVKYLPALLSGGMLCATTHLIAADMKGVALEEWGPFAQLAATFSYLAGAYATTSTSHLPTVVFLGVATLGSKTVAKLSELLSTKSASAAPFETVAKK